MYADVHLHLYEAPDPARLVEESMEEGVDILITAGEDVETSKRCVELTELPGVHAAVGIHPSRAGRAYDKRELEELVPSAVAIGEVGLDAKYERYGVSLDVQRRVFEEMLLLAKEYDLPVSVHSGRSYREVAELVIKYDVRAHFHWYSGDVSLALELADMGHLFSIGSALLHYKAYRGLVELLPLSALATETDYPVRIGGMENHPARVVEVANVIAEIRGEEAGRIIRTLYKNARSFFRV